MRILHTSDWHLGKSLEQISRIDEQREFIDFLCRTVEEQKIDLVLVAGDIYDTYNPSAAAEELFYEAVDRLNDRGRRAVIVIAGNHDNPERLCAASPLTYKNGIILLGYPSSDAGDYLPRHRRNGSESGGSHSTGVLNTGGLNTDKLFTRSPSGDGSGTGSTAGILLADSGPGWLELRVPGCSHHAVIITMPYPSEARLEEVLSQDADEAVLQKAYTDKVGSIFASLGAKFREDTVNLVVAHLFLLGGSASDSERTLQVGGAMTVDPSVMPEKTHFAALGHLHRPQEIRNAACPVFYAGSPLAYSFSEADYSKAIYIVDAIPGAKAVITPVYLDCGKPLRKWVAEEGIEQALQWCEAGRDANAWVDLEIVTDRVLTTDEQKNLRSRHPGIVNIRPRLRTGEVEILASRNREGRKIDELFGDYYKYRMGAEIPEDLMGAFLDVLNGESEDFCDSGDEEMNGEVAADETEAS